MSDDRRARHEINAAGGSLPDLRRTSRRAAHPLFILETHVTYLGGYVPVATISVGQRYDVGFLEDRFEILAHRRSEILAVSPYSDVEDVDIGGPGLVSSGGGFAGGGFGLTGAVEGMAIASVLNGLTSRTSIKTILRVQGNELLSSSCSTRG